MTPEQEPKYEARDGRIYNRASGVQIPDDEPVFIFRARDRHAIAALSAYMDMCSDSTHRAWVQNRVAHFEAFSVAHADRMKEPDSP